MENKLWIVSKISVILNQSIGTIKDDSIYWHTANGDVKLSNNALSLIDFKSNDKDYFALIGIAHSYNLNFEEYSKK